MDQPKLERLLRLMKMLTGNVSYSINDLSDKVNMSVRTVYRYIDTFREAGFVIKKRGDFIRIDKSSQYFKDISQLIHFTEEEACILKSAIESIDENNLLKQNLKKKLYTVYDYKILAHTTVHTKDSHNVNKLIEAIENKQQVILHNYRSANSKVIRNRKVEVFAFTTNYIQIWAYDMEKKKNKLFKVKRIEKVEILPLSWQYENEHQSGYIDIFRISSFNQYFIKLRLGLLSMSLLTEEYPLSEQYLTKISDNEWILETNVCSYEGIGRFVTGLLHDIEILESDDFKEYMKKRIIFLQKIAICQKLSK
ncbi:MAG: WYL domain-containing protein [Prevotellaceae bacterium]|jgi:predicted DNA-binding transcriptional regulator YafY|nr:WYL domain-containing protein [Prevotellaceae bacterium]